ncbi:MAG TPA: ThuA domain-containing protein [Flavobacteriales bacterium]|nr:ThuA domain-containing protein [Flavobacteriales bacterium]HMR27251.1 ThuA domain-containing protein [Flavobacteriales bacterium]
MKRFLYIALFAMPSAVHAQPRVLHFTRTSGFDHGTRAVSFSLFQGIAQDLGLLVDDDASGAPFSDPQVLGTYDAIVFANTSGDAILDAQQRAHFETWVANGGHVLGIHAASDTYRHSTANGGNTGMWDFYAELIGASVQQNPNHVSGTPSYAIQHIGSHASIADLPDPWVKNEEYYYWEGGYYGPDNVEVLRVEETVGPNGLVNSYDAPRAMSWYRSLPTGSRVFYTALGHAADNYTSDTLFRTHVKDALVWLLEGTTGIPRVDGGSGLHIHPNPASGEVTVVGHASWTGMPMQLVDAAGCVVLQGRLTGERTTFPLNSLPAGIYLVCTPGAMRPIQIMR